MGANEMTDEEEFLQEFYGKDDIKLTEKSCATCNFYMTPSYCDAEPVCKERSKWVKTVITDKEQAVEYILSLELEKGNKILQTREVIEAMLQAYLDGLAEGKKEAYELYNTEVDNIAKDYAERLNKLEQQISRMRNCFNCDNILDCRQYDTERINYGGCDNWKMIEE